MDLPTRWVFSSSSSCGISTKVPNEHHGSHLLWLVSLWDQVKKKFVDYASCILSEKYLPNRLTGPIVSSLVNKYGCRTITIVGALVAALGLGVSTIVNDVSTLYVTIGLLAGQLSWLLKSAKT